MRRMLRTFFKEYIMHSNTAWKFETNWKLHIFLKMLHSYYCYNISHISVSHFHHCHFMTGIYSQKISLFIVELKLFFFVFNWNIRNKKHGDEKREIGTLDSAEIGESITLGLKILARYVIGKKFQSYKLCFQRNKKFVSYYISAMM